MTQAQRLYKKLCQACKKPVDLPLEVLRINKINPEMFENAQIYGHVGCPKCAGSGYKGRSSLMEILLLDDHIKQLILKNANAKMLADRAVEKGMRTLRMVGFERVRKGDTSIEEVLRVAGGGAEDE
jgi:type II secretory ATPase GspE/PulE/Tfp pilus assembly ATPase PilB-like protein